MHHGKFPRSLNDILTINGLEFEGRPHSGIDDTKNIAKAVKALALKAHIFDYTNLWNTMFDLVLSGFSYRLSVLLLVDQGHSSGQ